MTIAELKQFKESENKVEFKEAKRNYPFNGGSHTAQDERRKCFLGYVVAIANEGGGMLVLGMADKHPHKVVGSDFGKGKLGVYSAIKPIDNKQAKSLVVLHLQEFGKAKMADFEALLNRFMNKNQIRYLIEQLVEQGVLDKEGQFKGTIYTVSKKEK